MLLIKLLTNLKKIYIIGKINLNNVFFINGKYNFLLIKKLYVEIRRTILPQNGLTYGNRNGKIYHNEKTGGLNMENLKKCTEKICSFYVSDWHLVTMLLPYINKELNEKANITTILENNIQNNIETLISKLNLQNEKKILEINWKNSQGLKYSYIDNELKKYVNKNNCTNIIFVNGSKNYIDIVNENVDKWICKNVDKLKKVKFKIVNCYEVTDFNSSIKEILDMHDKILNTAGEKEINEIFEGYKKEANEIIEKAN